MIMFVWLVVFVCIGRIECLLNDTTISPLLNIDNSTLPRLVTTTTASSTTTTAVTKPYINEFKILYTQYSPLTKSISCTLAIKSNFSSQFLLFNRFDVELITLNIHVNCSSSNQSWTRLFNDQLVRSSFQRQQVSLSVYNNEPKPGSNVECQAYAVDSSSNRNFTSSSRLVIDPLPVSELRLNKINETSLQLAWIDPAYNYDGLNIICEMNEMVSRRTEVNRFYTKTQRPFSAGLKSFNYLQLDGLQPGTNYNCSIYTCLFLDAASNRTIKVKSRTLNQMTELSQPEVVSVEFNEKQEIIVSLQPPRGLFDQFMINIINQPVNKTLFTHIFTVSSTGNYTHNFGTIKKGQLVEIWSLVQRKVNYNHASSEMRTEITQHKYSRLRVNNVKSNLSTVLDKISSRLSLAPQEVTNLQIFIHNKTTVNLSWHFDTNLNALDHFMIRISANAISVTFNTTSLYALVSQLRPEFAYSFQVTVCSTPSCEIKSAPRDIDLFRFDRKLNDLITVNDIDPETFNSNNQTQVKLSWTLSTIHSYQLCDLGAFSFNIFNSETNRLADKCLVPVDFCNTGRKQIKYDKCANFVAESLDCSETQTGSRQCDLIINGLSLNTRYSLAIGSISANMAYEFSKDRLVFKTKYKLPQIKPDLVHYNITQSAHTGSILSFTEPDLASLNLPITSVYLFLVKYESESSVDQENLNNQAYLENLLVNTPECKSNQSYPEYQCLLRSYSYSPVDSNLPNGTRIILIGNLKYYTFLMNNTSRYENITTELIDPGGMFKCFYLFKINNYPSTLQSSQHKLIQFYSSKLSKTWSASSLKSYLALIQPFGASFFFFPSGVEPWVFILICVLSSALLVALITTAFVFSLFRVNVCKRSMLKPATHVINSGSVSNFGGAADFMRHSTLVGNYQLAKFNLPPNKSKFDFVDFDLQTNPDFVQPSEFSRYDMPNIWLVKHANGDLLLDEEFRNLPDYSHIKSSSASQEQRNEHKNRFLDIKAYDDSRVTLDHSIFKQVKDNVPMSIMEKCSKSDQTSVDKSLLSSSLSTSSSSTTSDMIDIATCVDKTDQEQSDYINANFVQGFSHDKKFIATQGPKRETITDFWHMIWQYKVSAIVMLTKLVEKGVERCTQYWPDELNITETYGDCFDVTLKDQQVQGDFIKRTFHLSLHHPINNASSNTTNTPGSFSISSKFGSSVNNKILTVVQYYYPEWPDKDTPNLDPVSVLHLIREVNRNHLTYQYPIVVHCSAGVGRTGTYITLDAMIEKCDKENKIDIYGFISKIRERRRYLVQTAKQYVFIHQAMYEYCLYGFTDVEPGQLMFHYNKLTDKSTSNWLGVPVNTIIQNNGVNINLASSPIVKTGLEVEFEKLQNAFIPNMQAREAFSAENKSRNRDLNVVCYDENRVRLSYLTGSSYINATRIKNYTTNANNSTYCDLAEYYGGNLGSSPQIIITQDPLPNTLFEFYKLLIEYECAIVVSLNKEFEQDQESVYWPSSENAALQCEQEDVRFVIKLLKVETCKAFTRRELELVEHKYSTINKAKVVQFSFNDHWSPDRAPNDLNTFLDLICQVEKEIPTVEKNFNILVHSHGGGSNCSVFGALHILIDKVANDQSVDVCRVVKQLRTQRVNMIESLEQYKFLYECLIEYIRQEFSSFNLRNVEFRASQCSLNI